MLKLLPSRIGWQNCGGLACRDQAADAQSELLAAQIAAESKIFNRTAGHGGARELSPPLRAPAAGLCKTGRADRIPSPRASP